MKLNCANCHTEIKSENINITADLVKCHTCGTLHKASDLLSGNNTDTSASNKEPISLSPPDGSSIIMERRHNDTIEFTYPKKGFTNSTLPIIFFAVFLFGFAVIWTFDGTENIAIFFFSIPLWAFWLGLVATIINGMYQVQIITLDKQKLTIRKQRPIKPTLFETSIEGIQAIKMHKRNTNIFHTLDGGTNNPAEGSNHVIKLPAIISGTKTEYFFNQANDAEQTWIIDILDDLVNKIKG